MYIENTQHPYILGTLFQHPSILSDWLYFFKAYYFAQNTLVFKNIIIPPIIISNKLNNNFLMLSNVCVHIFSNCLKNIIWLRCLSSLLICKCSFRMPPILILPQRMSHILVCKLRILFTVSCFSSPPSLPLFQSETKSFKCLQLASNSSCS